MTLGEKIKELRERRGWSQHELARRAHVRQALLSELETGKKADTTGLVLRRLARTLGVTVDYLVGMYNGTVDPSMYPGEERWLDAPTLPPVTTILHEEHGCEEYSKVSSATVVPRAHSGVSLPHAAPLAFHGRGVSEPHENVRGILSGSDTAC